jgi:hypothetical protein
VSQAFAAILPLGVLRIPNLQPGGARADRVRAVFPLRDDTLEVVFASYGEELNAAAYDRMREFFRGTSLSIRVQDVMEDFFGGFRLICSDSVTFEVFPSASAAPHDVSEYWRLL